jgi:cysteinyl-tRNA synthetase
MTRKKEVFETVEPGVVRFYSCGPTVYDYAHIGNFRAFLTYDVAKRWLLYRGYEVRHVMNLTDVDDKIIRKVAASNGDLTAKQLTDKYVDAFFADLDLLNVIRADSYPRATDHIDDIEEVVAGLKKRGVAYEVDGSTYFSVGAFPNYGRLAQLENRNPRAATPGASGALLGDGDEYGKDDVRDFALWKAFKEEDGEVFWEPKTLAKGRPGWHIECTCMAIKYLGPQLDIHGGGIDLVFPHHENEIAQAEALTDRTFSRFWLHNGFVNIDDEKMSKSLGNFRTMRDIVQRPDDARAFRYLVVTSQYRSALAFTEQSLKSARNTIKRIDALRTRLECAIASSSCDAQKGLHGMRTAAAKAEAEFQAAMDDDLNTPRAAAALFSIVNVAEKLLKAGGMGIEAAAVVVASLSEFDRVFGLFYTPVLEGNAGESDAESGEVEMTPALARLLGERQKARQSKDWGRADEIRDELATAGFSIVDTKDGPHLKRKS